MRFEAAIQANGDGSWSATCDEPQCSSRGLSPANALDSLRDEIRYRLELCPCTTVDDSYVELHVNSGL